MELTIDKQDNYTLITLKERNLNSTVAPDLKSEFILLNTDGVKNIILDMTDVNFVDSSGLSAILIGNRMSKATGGSFVLIGVQENVNKLIKISQLDNILYLIPTLKEAIDFIILDEVDREINDEE